MKRIGAVLLGCALMGAVFAGCGNQQGSRMEGGEASPVKIGMLTHLNASEANINGLMKQIDEDVSSKLSCDYKYYDKMTSMIMGLESGRISEASVYDSVARYMTNRNDKLSTVEHRDLKLQDHFCCAVRKEDKELKAGLDKAISDMKADGTLETFAKDYITNLNPGEEPQAVPMPKTAGSSLRIGVTGDLPPLDLVLADGRPAGFNTAVLAEIGKRLGRNVEMVQIDSAARASALASKKVDIVFWAVVPFGDSKLPSDIDKPEGIELTIPYYQDKVVYISQKK